MRKLPFFKICPTASNSVDIIAAVLAENSISTRLIEPTFDNLPLILWRRGVKLAPIHEIDLIKAVGRTALAALLSANPCGALFLVQPNNPTGYTLDADCLAALAESCRDRGITLIIDNSFRFYKRRSFDDYEILVQSGVRFMAFEDTGKVWPTHDLKASLLFCSRDFEQLITSIYNELFLCTSRFSLLLLEQYILGTARVGLSQAVWTTVDERRDVLRRTITGTGLDIDDAALHSVISVEWLDCRQTGLRDLELTRAFASQGLFVLPGRQFFWNSGYHDDKQFNIRLALLRPAEVFKRAMGVIRALGPDIRAIS
jgi:aspartate/methionine/tyrosine aminotransferase